MQSHDRLQQAVVDDVAEADDPVVLDTEPIDLRTWGSESAGRLPERLRKLREDLSHFILPARRERTYPRAVKIKMSNYDRKRPLRSSSRRPVK